MDKNVEEQKVTISSVKEQKTTGETSKKNWLKLKIEPIKRTE